MFRAVTYPEHPGDLIVFDVTVAATQENEWTTEITVHGRYTGPTDILATEDYELTWVSDGARLLESGAAYLARSSGERVRQVWSSIITPDDDGQSGRTLPASGQVIKATVSPFEIDGQRMRYEWTGTVSKRSERGYA